MTPLSKKEKKKNQVNNKHHITKGEAAQPFELPQTCCWYSGHVGLFF